ncbi:MAG: dihydroneopterin aldolase [Alphaproteobacteria bacterium]
MDRVFLSNMAFFARHGVHDAERSLGQRFFVDVDCLLDTRPAAASDRLADAVCYDAVHAAVAAVMDGPAVRLLETLASRIAAAVLDGFPTVDGVRVAVRKPAAPVAGVLDHAGVEIVRRRGGGTD